MPAPRPLLVYVVVYVAKIAEPHKSLQNLHNFSANGEIPNTEH